MRYKFYFFNIYFKCIKYCRCFGDFEVLVNLSVDIYLVQESFFEVEKEQVVINNFFFLNYYFDDKFYYDIMLFS